MNAELTVDDLKAKSPQELLEWMLSLRGGEFFAETCVHEASHAVLAVLLGVPFDYVTVVPELAESGDVLAGFIRWKNSDEMTKYIFHNWALAAIAPQVALPLFGIEHTAEEDAEEFSTDEALLSVLQRYKPDLSRPSLRERARELLTPAVRMWVYRVAKELQARKTLVPKEVLALRDENSIL